MNEAAHPEIQTASQECAHVSVKAPARGGEETARCLVAGGGSFSFWALFVSSMGGKQPASVSGTMRGRVHRHITAEWVPFRQSGAFLVDCWPRFPRMPFFCLITSWILVHFCCCRQLSDCLGTREGSHIDFHIPACRASDTHSPAAFNPQFQGRGTVAGADRRRLWQCSCFPRVSAASQRWLKHVDLC